MAQITGGTVSVEDGLKKQEEYAPPRKVRVDLNFTVAEGESYQGIFETASQAASNRVHSLLHGTPIRSVVNDPQAPAETPASPPAEAPARRTRRTAAQIAADAAKAAGASPSGSGGGAQTSGDPADMDPTGGEEAVIHLPDETETFDIEAPAAETTAEETFDIEAPAAEAGEKITDADLNSAVQKKNAEIADPNAIRALIGSYNPDPKASFQLRQIDPAKRAEFLAKLGALKKAG